jgi:MYXO-CTERM domain-containing protein
VSSLSSDYAHSANPFGGSSEVTFAVENRGNVRVSGTPVISVGGPFGIMKQEITLDPISELLPGQTIDLTASLDGVPALFLNKTEVRIDIDEASARGGAEDVVASSNGFTPPITIMLLLALALLALLARRSFQRRRRAALPVAPTIGAGSAGDDGLRIVDREPQHQ